MTRRGARGLQDSCITRRLWMRVLHTTVPRSYPQRDEPLPHQSISVKYRKDREPLVEFSNRLPAELGTRLPGDLRMA